MRQTLFLLLVAAALYGAQDTTTTTTFGTRTDLQQTDEYGNALYTQDVTISTENFDVETLWSRFKDAENKQRRFEEVKTRMTARIIVEATSACALDDTLPEEGCSGQKPFLINNEAVVGLEDGERIQLIFQPATDDESGASLFDSIASDRFYPLDVLRDGAYYQEPLPDAPYTESPDSFFSFITGSFDRLFNHTLGFGRDFFGVPGIADIKYTPRSDEAQARRQRYIANVIGGIQRAHRMTMTYPGHEATPLESSVNIPVSLLHYAESLKSTEEEQCRLLFLDLSPEGLLCRTLSGFGLEEWIPFFSHTNTTRVDVNTITIDTENALLAMAEQAAGEEYVHSTMSNDEESLTLLQELLKPVTALTKTLKTILFGSERADIVPEPVEAVYAFPPERAMSMTFAVTDDGSRVDRFETFKLTGLHSVYGEEIYGCRVEYKGVVPGVVGLVGDLLKLKGFEDVSPWTETFYMDVEAHKLGPEGNMDNTEWVDWCQKHTENKGVFDYLRDVWSGGESFNAATWLVGLINSLLGPILGFYEVLDAETSLKRALVLELQKERLDPVSSLTTKSYKIVNVTH